MVSKSFIGLAVGVSFLVMGCSSSQMPTNTQMPQNSNAKTSSSGNIDYGVELANAPKWVLQPPHEYELAAVGNAKVGKGGIKIARKAAILGARTEISNQMGSLVKDLTKDFMQQIGVGDAQTVDTVSSFASQSVTKQFTRARVKDMFITKSGELWILVIASKEALKNTVRNAVKTSLGNKQALYQKFQAKQGFEALDKEMEKFTKYQQSQ